MVHLDRTRILDADVFPVRLDGRVPDEGACVELGMPTAEVPPEQRDVLSGSTRTPGRPSSAGD